MMVKRYLRSEPLAFLCAFLSAIEPFFIAYSHMARNYCMTIFMTMLGTYFFLRILDRRAEGKTTHRLVCWLWLVICPGHTGPLLGGYDFHVSWPLPDFVQSGPKNIHWVRIKHYWGSGLHWLFPGLSLVEVSIRFRHWLIRPNFIGDLPTRIRITMVSILFYPLRFPTSPRSRFPFGPI